MKPIFLLFFTLFLLFKLTAQQELQTSRDMFSKTYFNEDGRKETIINVEPIHYYSNGSWKDISLQLVQDLDKVTNLTNPLGSIFPNTLNSDPIQFVLPNSDTLNVNGIKALIHYENGSINVLDSSLQTGAATINGQKIHYHGHLSDVDEVYSIEPGRIKNELILNVPPSELNHIYNGFYGFSESIELPQGYVMEFESGLQSGLLNESILVRDEEGYIQLRIPVPVFFDNNGLASDGNSMVMGSYLLEQQTNIVKLSTLVSVSWLKDSNRSYPVTLDPTIILNGIDGGWMSANNFVNNPNFAFVGVCCGNLMHRAWIRFNTSSIPDNNCVLSAELELYSDGVGGSAAEQTWVNDVTGAHGPYASINNVIYDDLGDGKYIDYIATTAGTVPFFNLGSTAASHITNSLFSNFFQLALKFENEPSTNWKRYIATSCRLRIVHDIPASCILLNNELKEFNTVCDQEHIHINWVTTETNNIESFVVERSINAIDFSELINFSKQDFLKNDNGLIYQHKIETQQSHTDYFRLKMIGMDGSFEYSNIITSSCKINDQSIELAPVPAQDVINLIMNANESAKISISLMDNLGQLNIQSDYSLQPGSNRIPIDIRDLPEGIYGLSVEQSGNKLFRQFVKQ